MYLHSTPTQLQESSRYTHKVYSITAYLLPQDQRIRISIQNFASIAQHLWILTICNAPVACLHRILSQQQLFQTVWPVGTESGCQYPVVRRILRRIVASSHPASPAWKGWRPPSWSGQGPAVDPWYGPLRESKHWTHHTVSHTTSYHVLQSTALHPNASIEHKHRRNTTSVTWRQWPSAAGCEESTLAKEAETGTGQCLSWNTPNAKGMRVHCVECRPKWKDPKIQGLQRRWTMSMDILRLPIETQRITINPELNNQIKDQVPNLCLQKTSNFRPIWANAPIFCTHNGRRFSDLNVGKLNKSLAWGQTQPGQSRVSGLAIPAG